MAPALAALALLPLLTRGYGAERFGLLALAWSLIGGFSMLDLGLSRALTSLLAARLGSGREDEIPRAAWTALWLLGGLGALGGGLLALAAARIVGAAASLPAALRPEALTALYLLALAAPLVLLTGGLRGILEALHRFDLSNLARIPLALLTLIAPALVLPFSRSLVPAVAALVLGRLLGVLLHGHLCLRAAPTLGRLHAPRPGLVGELLGAGGAMTVTSLVGPILSYVDRWLLGTLASAQAVAFYAAPQDALTRLLLVPGALVGVLFPAFGTLRASEPERAARVYSRALKLLLVLLWPPLLVVAAFARPLLAVWLGEEFAAAGAAALRWMTLGVLLNGLAHVPLALLQGAGRPGLAAWLHAVQLPLYLLVLERVIRTHGATGCAAAWSLRAALDALALLALAPLALPAARQGLGRLLAVTLGAALLLAAAAWAATALAALVAFLGFLVLVGAGLLSPAERALLRSPRTWAGALD